MNESLSVPALELFHERVDDIPLLFGLIERLRLPDVLDEQLKTHAKQQGLSNGWLAAVWLVYVLSQGDHRKSSVQEWADRHHKTLSSLLGQSIRPGLEFNDDRLGGLLRRLSNEKKWHKLEAALFQSTVVVYDVPLESVRLDSTTTYGYHSVAEDGVMQFGHSKDHRPDLPQVKIMAACSQPCGLLLGADVVSGEKADDRLYTPLIDRVRKMLGRTGLLYAGDCKMASLETRAQIVDHKDYYLAPLPLIGEVSRLMPQWIDAAVGGAAGMSEPPGIKQQFAGREMVELFFDGRRPPEEQLLGAGYEFERPMYFEKVIEKEHTDALGQTMTLVDSIQKVVWTERVQVIRSHPLALHQIKALNSRLDKAHHVLQALTPEIGRGKRQFREEAALQAAIAEVLQRHEVTGLLEVSYERQEEVSTSYIGRGRGGHNRPTQTKTQVRYEVKEVVRDEVAIERASHRLGWRVQVTNQPANKMSLLETVLHYRLGSCLEQDFHMIKDQPLGISPLYVRRDDQIRGLTHLLMLALRLMLLIQLNVKQCLERTQESLEGLYDGQPKRTTTTPTAVRLLKAVCKDEITLTRIEYGDETRYHLTPLSGRVLKILEFLKLSPSLYTCLTRQNATLGYLTAFQNTS